jgi:hypothetical protein
MLRMANQSPFRSSGALAYGAERCCTERWFAHSQETQFGPVPASTFSGSFNIDGNGAHPGKGRKTLRIDGVCDRAHDDRAAGIARGASRWFVNTPTRRS